MLLLNHVIHFVCCILLAVQKFPSIDEGLEAISGSLAFLSLNP